MRTSKSAASACPASKSISNPKEVTIVLLMDGTWRLLFEYAENGASKVGVASAPAVDGPWTVNESLFWARPDRWDAWHLSTGPMLMANPARPVMLYNGATKDAHWRIGWVAFNADLTAVVARGEEPLITPPIPMAETQTSPSPLPLSNTTVKSGCTTRWPISTCVAPPSAVADETALTWV